MKNFLEFARPELNIPEWVNDPLSLIAWYFEKLPDDEFNEFVEKLTKGRGEQDVHLREAVVL